MKRMIMVAVMSLVTVLPLSVLANHDGDSGKMAPSKERAEKYEGYAKSYDSQAAGYDKKAAASEGEKAAEYRALALNLRGCAVQKRRMSKAYAAGDRALLNDASMKYGRLCKERKQIGSPFKGNTYAKKSADKSSCKTRQCKEAQAKKQKKTPASNAQQKKIEQMEAQIKALQKQLDGMKKSGKNESFCF
jgi:hypothetical protein